MSRNVFGWDLPPGVTHRMIDEAQGAYDCTCAEEVDALEEAGLDREVAEAQVEAEPCEVCRAERAAEDYEAGEEDHDRSRWEDQRLEEEDF